eukprot:NODE_12142_length_266_cov_5.554502.p3 GENE.NODE_12142_length_266_cov_5.554502~~NODE_12142_length_266_cov_5.554502.p3  ORF type:complete len:59 (-),score=23.71 NODE_12142_length_266_cov_5.554502:57-233(-)
MGDRAEIGKALQEALGALNGKGTSSVAASCMSMFPDGKRPADMKESNPVWQSCKKYCS